MSDNQFATIAGGVIGAVAGTFVGQPQLGFALGSAIGGALVPPEAEKIKGPKLQDTSAQSDDLGAALPWVYGTQRVPAWRDWIENGEFREVTTTSGGGGKGGPPEPEREETRYFATFIAVLAEAPSGKTYRVRRIWGDSVKLVDARDQEERTDGQFAEDVVKSGIFFQEKPSAFTAVDSDSLEEGSAGAFGASNISSMGGSITLLDGSEDQKPPSRLVADKGKAPGYRGVLALYFQDLALEKFGNRVPKISAEVVEEGSGKIFQNVFQSEITIAGDENAQPETAHIQDGLLVVNKAENSNRHINDDSPYFDFTISPDGRVVDQTENDVLTIGINPDNEIDPEFPNAFDSLIGEVKWLNTSTGSLWQEMYYAGFESSGSDLEAVTQISRKLNSLTPIQFQSSWIDRREEDITLGMSITSDKSNLFVWYNLESGTEYTRHDPTVGLNEVLESGKLIFEEGGVGNITNPGASSGRKAFVDSTLQQLLVSAFPESGTGDRILILMIRDQNGDYQEVVRDTVNTETGVSGQVSLDKGSFEKGVLRTIDNGEYVVIAAGLVGANATTLGAIVSDLAERAGLEPSEIDTSALTAEVRGYVSRDTTARSAIKQLRQLFPFDVRDAGYQLEFVPRGQSVAMTLTDEDLQAHEPGQEMPAIVKATRQSEVDMPETAEITYNDIGRRYEQNLQRRRRQAVEADGKVSIQAPIAFSATEAVRAADVVLKDAWQSQISYEATGSMQLLELEPADVVQLDTSVIQGEARIEQIDDGSPGLRRLRMIPQAAGQHSSNAEGETGDVGGGSDGAPGPTSLMLLDVPALTASGLRGGHYYALGGVTDAWDSASLIEYRGGQQAAVGGADTSATFGFTVSVLGDGPTTIWDRDNTLNLRLSNGALESATELDVYNGANVLAVDTKDPETSNPSEWEILQFRDAVQEDDGSWTISHLLRGRRGTERLTGEHNAQGARVVVLSDLAGVNFLQREEEDVGSVRGFAAVTSGTAPPPEPRTALEYRGRNLTPLSPVQVQGSRDGDDLTITWRRRTRRPADYIGNRKAPLEEESEAYEVDILDGSTVVRTLESTSESVTYTASQQTTDFGSAQSSVTVRVYQLSDVVGRGWPTEATV